MAREKRYMTPEEVIAKHWKPRGTKTMPPKRWHKGKPLWSGLDETQARRAQMLLDRWLEREPTFRQGRDSRWKWRYPLMVARAKDKALRPEWRSCVIKGRGAAKRLALRNAIAVELDPLFFKKRAAASRQRKNAPRSVQLPLD